MIFLPLLGVDGFFLCPCSPPLIVVAYSAFIDVLLALYPSLVLWRLPLNRKKKIRLSIALGLRVIWESSSIGSSLADL